MASGMYISVCIISALALNSVSGTNFRVSPTTINIDGADPTTKLTLTCSPDSPGITTLYSIVIGKLGQNNADSDIVRINSQGITVIDTSYGQRLTRTGSVSGTNGNLVLEISSLICSDAASFYCKTIFDTATETGKIERANVNVTARTYPGEITMTVDPDFSVYSNPPVSVTFKCYGDNIGNQYVDNQASLWQWQTRTFNGNWFNYQDTSNITYRTPSAGANCQYSGGTDLVHTVTSADNGKQFRCYALTQDYSANKTVYTQNPTTNSPGGDGDPAQAGTNLGLILGVVFGVLAAIVIVVVLVYFLVFRRKSGGDDYDTGEGKGDRPEMTDNVVYSTPASRDNKPRHMKGRENDAMDEPHEKNPRSYYTNDYGHSNTAMDDDSRHDRSYDGDNTDSRMRGPYGSAV